jgi:NitT/TauT family transport system ATP-binding protein
VEEAVYLADRVVVLGRSPGRVTDVIEIRPVREAEGWEKLASEEVMEMPGFGHLRARIWRQLRAEMQTSSDGRGGVAGTGETIYRSTSHGA